MSKTELSSEKSKVQEEESEERKALLGFFGKLDNEMLKQTAQAISMMVRAFEGRSIEPEDIITRLTNVKDIVERSRYPTYPLLAKQVYLRLIAHRYPEECKAFGVWADIEARALIEYKGEGRKEYVEMTRHTALEELQQFYFGEKGVPGAPKRKWYQRKPKEQTSEFVAQ